VHFGHPRVPENLEELQTFEVGADALKSMAGDAFEVLKVFVAQLQDVDYAGPVLTVERLRAQLLRNELDRSIELLRHD
jgi:hypothetical protein